MSLDSAAARTAYQALCHRALHDKEAFWAEAASALEWTRPYERVFDDSNPPFYRWFTGGGFNICFNALDRHVRNGAGERVALIHESPITGTQRKFTYRQLLDAVAHFAGALARLGVEKGDRVVIYMPMVPEAAIAMLACARLGAIHSVVFGGFAAKELATRIDDAKPKLVISASCGIEPNRIVAYKPLLDEAIALAQSKPAHCVILQRVQQAAQMVPGRDIDWQDALAGAEPAPVADTLATDPLYVLYTSGTTGMPKGVVRDHGGYAVALNWSLPNIFGLAPGGVMFSASDVGWVVGHTYIVYGPLLHGCTSILYEGKPVGTPDAGAFWRVVREHKVEVLFTAPTALRAIRREDPEGLFAKSESLAPLRGLYMGGERCDPSTLAWCEQTLGVVVVDNWWQTETGWPICANLQGVAPLPIKPGSPSCAVPGWDIHVVDNNGTPLPPGEIGNLVIKLPLPPGALPSLWNQDDRFVKSYLSAFPGYYQTGDAGVMDEEGYIFVMTRTDDIINVAAHRLSTGGIEEVLSSHPDVAECAVIGVRDALKGQVPVGFVVLKQGATATPQEIERDMIQRVRDKIGPVASYRRTLVVDRLPKTRSGKILRQVMRGIADGQAVPVPPTIEDPAVLEEIRTLIDGAGLQE